MPGDGDRHRARRVAPEFVAAEIEPDQKHVQRDAELRHDVQHRLRFGRKQEGLQVRRQQPNKEGPSTTPAIISPITCGWRSQRRTSQPHSRQAARITNICRKKIMGRVRPDGH